MCCPPLCKELADGVWTGSHSYELAGRLASISNASGGNDWSAFTYNGRSQVKKITYGNNVTSWFNYNNQNGFLTSQETRDGISAASPLLLGLSYARNDAGMILSVAATGGTTAQNNAKSWAYRQDGSSSVLPTIWITLCLRHHADRHSRPETGVSIKSRARPLGAWLD